MLQGQTKTIYEDFRNTSVKCGMTFSFGQINADAQSGMHEHARQCAQACYLNLDLEGFSQMPKRCCVAIGEQRFCHICDANKS